MEFSRSCHLVIFTICLLILGCKQEVSTPDANKQAEDTAARIALDGDIGQKAAGDFGVVNAQKPSALVAPFLTVDVGRDQISDTNILVNFPGVITSSAPATARWVQTAGPEAFILKPNQANTQVLVPDLSEPARLKFRLSAATPQPLYYADELVLDVLPLASQVKVVAARQAMGANKLVFKVQLAQAALSPLEFTYSTLPGEADYFQAARGTVQFAPGEKEKFISIQLNPVEKFEANTPVMIEVAGQLGNTTYVSRGVGIIEYEISNGPDTTDLYRFVGVVDNTVLNERVLHLQGMTALANGDRGQVRVVAGNSDTQTQFSVVNGRIDQKIEISNGENRVEVAIFAADEIVERATFNVIGNSKVAPARLRLEWDADYADIDLHIVSASGEHVSYLNLTGSFGDLDIDDTDGFGPETFAFTQLVDGPYKVYVNYYAAHELKDPTQVTVKISRNEGAWEILGSHTFNPGDVKSNWTVVEALDLRDTSVPIAPVAP